jgi:hypothetical protein
MKEKTKSKPIATNARPKTEVCLRLPNDAELDELARSLKLSRSQVHNLRVTIERTYKPLGDYLKFHEARPQLVRRLKLVETAFNRLDLELQRQAHHLADLLPHSLLSYIGSAVSMSEINSIMGSDMTPTYVDTQIARKAKGKIVSTLEMDAISVGAREAIAMKHGDVILPELIARLHKPLLDWVELDRQNKGGRPEILARTYLILTLAENAPSILGKEARKSETGPFARLCAAVLPLCGIDPTGIEKVIPRILTKQQTSRLGGSN